MTDVPSDRAAQVSRSLRLERLTADIRDLTIVVDDLGRTVAAMTEQLRRLGIAAPGAGIGDRTIDLTDAGRSSSGDSGTPFPPVDLVQDDPSWDAARRREEGS